MITRASSCSQSYGRGVSTWWFAVVRLAGLLTSVGFATSRIGLLFHELVGHGGATLLVGGEVTDVQLFWFAGGWIRHRIPAGGGGLAISLGGVVVEAAIGASVWYAVRHRHSLGGRVGRATGAALIVHASWYLATGVWHGYGDGTQLHRDLGDAKWVVAVPVAAIACAAAYAGARAVLGALAGTVPGRRRARITGTVIAIVIAGGIQAGAAIGEVKLRRDTTYTQVMRPEREREIARELARWAALQAQRGIQPSDQAREAMQRDLDRQHQTFPFAWLLGVLTVASVIAGAVRAAPAHGGGPVPARLLAIAGSIAVASIAAVIALDLAFH